MLYFKNQMKIKQNKLTCIIFIIFLLAYMANEEKCCFGNIAEETLCRFQSTDMWEDRKSSIFLL